MLGKSNKLCEVDKTTRYRLALKKIRLKKDLFRRCLKNRYHNKITQCCFLQSLIPINHTLPKKIRKES